MIQSCFLSLNYLSWKRPLRLSRVTISPALARPPVNHVPKCHIHMSLNTSRNDDYTILWAACPRQGLTVLSVKKVFPNVQSKYLLVQFEAIFSWRIPLYLAEEPNSHLATPSCQWVLESDKITSEPPFLQAKYAELSQLTLIRLVLQTLPRLFAFLWTCSNHSMSFF